jgi:hypothetical protein
VQHPGAADSHLALVFSTPNRNRAPGARPLHAPAFA